MRARNLKPGFFKNEALAEVPFEARILFAGLWAMADRAGRLEDRPKRIKAEIFPYDRVNVQKMLDVITSHGFITRYESGKNSYIQIVNFEKHQNPHPHEAKSNIPACNDMSLTRRADVMNPSSLNPSSLNPESITPSAPKKTGAATAFWKELIEHINSTWERKKRGAKYVWSGKDFAGLKRVLRVYQAYDVMALWDVYISSSDEFAQRQGYNVPEFVRQLPRLVDGQWKAAAARYMEKLMPVNPEGVNQIKSLVAGLAKEMPR